MLTNLENIIRNFLHTSGGHVALDIGDSDL